MGIRAVLIDKSEIVQKMLSHCLHYFSTEVSRFDSLEDCQSHFTDKPPDIAFMDWEPKKKNETVIYSAIEKMKPVPVVLLYRENNDRIQSIPPDKIPYKLKKPLEPKAVRDIFTELVPQIKDSSLHPFLKFPQKEKIASPPEPELDEKSKTFTAQTTEQEVKMSLNETSPAGFKIPVEKKSIVTSKKIKKEDINIDEDTQNDLAPMAMKSSAIEKENSKIIKENLELNEKDILKVLNKYKDSLEFQKLMESVLSEYAQKTVKNILQGDKVTDLMQQPLKEFKEGDKFKQLVEQQVSQYVREQLPLLIKEIVEREIKKIIGD